MLFIKSLILLLFFTSIAHATVQNAQNIAGGESFYSCEKYGMLPSSNPNSSALVNSVALQNCLNNYSNVSITAPGVYPLNFNGVIKSDHHVIFGNGVIFQLPNSSSSGTFLTNANYASTSVVTTTAISLGTTSSYGTVATLTFSGSALPLNSATGVAIAAGDYIEITQDTSNQYNNIWKVAAANNTSSTVNGVPAWSVTFLTNGSNYTASTGTGLRVAAADANITIEGTATIDQNSKNITCTNTLSANAFVFNRVLNLKVSDVNVINVCYSALATSNVFNTYIRNISVNNTRSVVEQTGPFINYNIDGVTGATNYDAFVLVSGHNVGLYSVTDESYPLNAATNITGTLNNAIIEGTKLNITNAVLNNTGTGIFSRISPDQVYGAFTGIHISDSYTKTGISGISLQVSSTGPAYVNNLVTDRVVGLFHSIGTGIVLDGYIVNQTGANPSSSTAGWSIGNGIITVGGTIRTMSINDSDVLLNVSGLQQFVNVLSGGSIKDLYYKNNHFNSSGTASQYQLLQLNGGTVDVMHVIGNRIDGLGSLFNGTSTSTLNTVNASDTVFNGYYLATPANSTAINIKNCSITNSPLGYQLNYYQGNSSFSGTIASNTLTVATGTSVVLGNTLVGSGVTANTIIVNLLTTNSPTGFDTYSLSQASTVSSSTTFNSSPVQVVNISDTTVKVGSMLILDQTPYSLLTINSSNVVSSASLATTGSANQFININESNTILNATAGSNISLLENPWANNTVIIHANNLGLYSTASNGAFGTNLYASSGTVSITANGIYGPGNFTQFSGSETIQYNNPDGSAPADFTKIVHTATGSIVSVKNSSVPAGYVGAYKQYTPHISDGTYFRALVNPTLTATGTTGNVSATLSTIWLGNSGTQNVVFSNGQVANVTFTNGSSSVTWTTPSLTSNITSLTPVVAGYN